MDGVVSPTQFQGQSAQAPEAPLALGANTMGSVKQATVWRKPRNQVLGYGKATSGSVLNPQQF